MLRLQRVTFLALNQFLGLGRELLNQVHVHYIVYALSFLLGTYCIRGTAVQYSIGVYYIRVIVLHTEAKRW